VILPSAAMAAPVSLPQGPEDFVLSQGGSSWNVFAMAAVLYGSF
jgi:hypothetical protein